MPGRTHLYYKERALVLQGGDGGRGSLKGMGVQAREMLSLPGLNVVFLIGVSGAYLRASKKIYVIRGGNEKGA